MNGVTKPRGLNEEEWNELQLAARGWWPYMRRSWLPSLVYSVTGWGLMLLIFTLAQNHGVLQSALSLQRFPGFNAAWAFAAGLLLFGTWNWWMARRLARTTGLC